MTASTEAEADSGQFGPGWRAERARRQEAVLQAGSTVLSCSAAYGAGGLGRHLREIQEALERAKQPVQCLCGGVGEDAGEQDVREIAPDRLVGALGRFARRSPAWRLLGASVAFDIAANRALPDAQQLISFSGQCLRQQRTARARGFTEISLVSPTAHMRQISRRYEQAWRSHPIERPWTTRVIRRSLGEYELADRIYVSSEHVRSSFVEEGIAEEKLALFPLTPDPRFTPAPREPRETFDVVYVGSLSVVKGVPLLIDAVRRLPAQDLRLQLVGGWESRGMRRYLERACAEDPRIALHVGDPLPHLRRASLYAHASYEDGFGYSAAEAMACGVPVIVSDATGMKELVEPGRTGAIVAAGDVDALASAIEAAYRGELLHG
jgi:glycosyltransferase involved in cell wall biosynthesis